MRKKGETHEIAVVDRISPTDSDSGMTYSQIGSMGPKVQNKSRRMAGIVRTEINRGLGKMLMTTAKKPFKKSLQSKRSKEGRDPLSE